ncbi:hypothetical protein AVEN_5840-1 [Araneus ventricosus]|uniref:Uncharacterized protein n=1 Tax=Araneus ventricosus TaxID=182803 RepID=A0A4Y2RCF0_ARAVE|nr:hypothetical protein AVEN_5840-1 [Araneus ventricosus]
MFAFLDSSKRSLKCELWRNGNVYGVVVPVDHSDYLRELYNYLKMVTDLLKYLEYHWIIYVQLKMLNILLHQRKGFTKFRSLFACGIDEIERNTGLSMIGLFVKF